MTLRRITLPPNLANEPVVGGIRFVSGTTVAPIGPSKESFFRAVGAQVEDPEPKRRRGRAEADDALVDVPADEQPQTGDSQGNAPELEV